MDPEIKKALEALRAELGKNADVVARIDGIEVAAKNGTSTVTALRAEMDTLKAAVVTRENEIKELQQKARVIAVAQDPITQRHEAMSMFGRICRAELCRARNEPVPAVFAEEAQVVRAYREEVAKRATLTPMAATGSYLVPTVTMTALIDTLEEVSAMLGLVDFIPGLPVGGTINIPTLLTRPAMQPKRAGTDTAMTQSDPTFGQLSLSPNESYIFFPIDNKFMQMSPFDLGNICMNALRDGMADKLAYWLLRADGTATYNSITGLLNETTGDYIYDLPAGKMAFSDLSALDLNKIMAKCLKRGRARGVWLMSLDIQGQIEEIDRAGKVPLITYAQDGTPRLKQREIIIEEYMPDLSESAKSTAFLGFGDPKTIIMGQCGAMEFASDTSYLFGKNQTAFRATALFDIKRKPVATFAIAKTAGA